MRNNLDSQNMFQSWMNLFCLFFMLLLVHLIISCGAPRKPTFPEMNRWELSDFSEGQVKNFLDKSYKSPKERRLYWEPMMEKIVKAKISGQQVELWVPMNHLKRAIRRYNETNKFRKQQDAVYIFYWQIYQNLETQEKYYGTQNDWKSGDEGPMRSYLRKYLPTLLKRDDADFNKIYKLVKQNDPQLIKEIFETNPFERSY